MLATNSIPPFRSLLVTIIFVLLMIGSSIATGGTPNDYCDLTLTAVEGPYGYKKRDNRCEGLYQKPLSTQLEIEPISLLRGYLNFDLDKDNYLYISVPRSSLLQHDEVHIRAFSIRENTHYQMDTTLHPGDTLQWPLYEVLKPNGLDDDDIGVYGWITNEHNDKIWVPIVISRKAAHVVPSDKDPVTLTWFTKQYIDKVLWGSPDNLRDTKLTRVYPYRSFSLPVPQLNGKYFEVQLAARDKNTGEWTYTDPLKVINWIR